MIAVGKRLNGNFSLKVVQVGTVREAVFSELLTSRTIVSVYMKANTGSCDKQTDSLATAAAEFAAAGYTVIALSRDTAGALGRYAAKQNLPYLLASDPKDLFAQATDSIVEKSMYGRTFFGPQRAAYVLDRDGTVLAIVEKVDPANHAAQLRAALAGLPPR